MLIKIVHTKPSCAELAISGEVDMAVADELLRAATAALRDNSCDNLVLDLSEVTFIDSSGLGRWSRSATRPRTGRSPFTFGARHHLSADS
jgi:anti-anti-sigma factor